MAPGPAGRNAANANKNGGIVIRADGDADDIFIPVMQVVSKRLNPMATLSDVMHPHPRLLTASGQIPESLAWRTDPY
jgi:hypothetical protein